MKLNHDFIEQNSWLMIVLIVLVVPVGGLVEIVPLYFQRQTMEPVEGVKPQADGSINVDGNVTIRDLNRAMDWSLPDDEAVTVAGLVISDLGRVPAATKPNRS